MKKYICQINNLKIYDVKYQGYDYRYIVVAPDKRVLEGFTYSQDAKIFCQNTKDFLKK